MNCRATLFFLLATAAVLTGCKGSVTLDMAADGPADTRIVDINTELVGVEFQRSDGTTRKIEFTESEPIDLMQLVDGQNSIRLLTSEEIPEGSYTGVRLIFDNEQDATVTRFDGTQYDLSITEAEYAPVEFTIKKDRTTRENLWVMLDLRQSLILSDDGRDYTLTPVLRTAEAEEAATLTGLVNVTCPTSTTLNQPAVYLYEGRNVVPNDIGSPVTPFATSRIFNDPFSGQFGYALRYLPSGDYTISFVCRSNDDDPAVDDDIEFIRTANIALDDAETRTYDFLP